MTVCWQALILLCCVLYCVDSSTPSPVLQRNKYNNSFRLTRSTRTRVQQLQKKYKEQKLVGRDIDYRSLQLKDLPSLSTDFASWLNMTDSERLQAAFRDMQAYWNKLEWKRKQLVLEERAQRTRHGVPTTLPQSIRNIQLDLRDLMSQVSSQMSYRQNSWRKPVPVTLTTPLNVETSSKRAWDSHVEGYIILRDLDLYLTKLARDFLLLASKTKTMTQQ